MIQKLHIKNFKSIEELEIDCARINLFIGEPNTGKSNILESIGILSSSYTKKIDDFVRFEENINLFYNGDISKKVGINYHLSEAEEHTLEISVRNDIFEFISKGHLHNCHFQINSGMGNTTSSFLGKTPIVKSYSFNSYKTFPDRQLDFLYPPSGRNLMQILSTKPDILKHVSEMLKRFGYKLAIDNARSKLSIATAGQLVLNLTPYFTISDTLQRMIFYYTIIESNTNSIIVLEEPETHIFPFYNEQLALMIADNSNQFFIATHNPYFLNMLINKTSADTLNVFKVTSKDYQTHAKLIDKNTLQKFVINDNDILLNIDRLGESE